MVHAELHTTSVVSIGTEYAKRFSHETIRHYGEQLLRI